MCGLKLLGQVSETFQIAKKKIGVIMGGVHFILLGDFYQLDAVKDIQMYRADSKNVHAGFDGYAHHGVKVFQSI